MTIFGRAERRNKQRKANNQTEVSPSFQSQQVYQTTPNGIRTDAQVPVRVTKNNMAYIFNYSNDLRAPSQISHQFVPTRVERPTLQTDSIPGEIYRQIQNQERLIKEKEAELGQMQRTRNADQSKIREMELIIQDFHTKLTQMDSVLSDRLRVHSDLMKLSATKHDDIFKQNQRLREKIAFLQLRVEELIAVNNSLRQNPVVVYREHQSANLMSQSNPLIQGLYRHLSSYQANQQKPSSVSHLMNSQSHQKQDSDDIKQLKDRIQVLHQQQKNLQSQYEQLNRHASQVNLSYLDDAERRPQSKLSEGSEATKPNSPLSQRISTLERQNEILRQKLYS